MIRRQKASVMTGQTDAGAISLEGGAPAGDGSSAASFETPDLRQIFSEIFARTNTRRPQPLMISSTTCQTSWPTGARSFFRPARRRPQSHPDAAQRVQIAKHWRGPAGQPTQRLSHQARRYMLTIEAPPNLRHSRLALLLNAPASCPGGGRARPPAAACALPGSFASTRVSRRRLTRPSCKASQRYPSYAAAYLTFWLCAWPARLIGAHASTGNSPQTSDRRQTKFHRFLLCSLLALCFPSFPGPGPLAQNVYDTSKTHLAI